MSDSRAQTESEAGASDDAALGRALFAESESVYLRLLAKRLEASGAIGDVFGWMVVRNVPLFILEHLWPERFAALRERTQTATAAGRRAPFVAFVAAEPGWKGRIDNLRSYVDLREADEPENKTVRLHLNKNHALACDAALLLLRVRRSDDPADLSDDEIALVWLDAETPDPETAPDSHMPGNGLHWKRRLDRAELTLPRTDRAPLVHYELSGETSIPAEQARVIRRSAYRRHGLEAPRRELSSLAVLSLALLRRHGLAIPEEIREQEAQLLAARDAGRLDAQALRQAQELFRWFLETSAAEQIELHPVWERMRALAGPPG